MDTEEAILVKSTMIFEDEDDDTKDHPNDIDDTKCDIKSTINFEEEDDEDIKHAPDEISQPKCDVCGTKTKEEYFEHLESKIAHHVIEPKVSLRSNFENP